jgi:activator of 2-hydroxyglutaryl-CoA dehydratase
VDCQTNDSCASGSGRFLELIRQRLHIDSVLMEALLGQDQQIALHSTCAVFAESEIIRLLAHGVSKDAILGGVAASIAARIAVLAERVPVKAPAVLIGGLAESHGMCKILSRTLGVEIKPLQNGTYAGAIGAACFGFSDEQYEEIISHNATSASLQY